MYTYKAKIIDLYDGDTVTAIIDLGFKLQMERRFRLWGIDTPELRGAERNDGLNVKQIVSDKILDKYVTIRTYKDHKKGKYGRYLMEIFLEDGTNLNKWLVDNEHAECYLKSDNPFTEL